MTLDSLTDALLTQRKIAAYLVEDRKAHYHFIVKGNQPTLLHDLELYFQGLREPDFVGFTPPDHGRIEIRSIWVTDELNEYLDFPHVGQGFMIERRSEEKKTGKISQEIAYGIISRTPEQANAKRLLKINRGHLCIENSCHYIIDWNFQEDRCRISNGFGPENTTRLRRFAAGLIKSKGARSVSQKMRELNRNVRLVLDYLRMTNNSCSWLNHCQA